MSKIFFFFTKQLSRVFHRLPRPSHLAGEKSYKRISKILQTKLGKEAKLLVVSALRESDYKYFLSNSKAICIDIQRKKGVDIIADAHFLPFKPASFDGAILQAVLQYVHYPEVVVANVFDVLKRGGVVYANLPLCQQEWPDTDDLWRWTEKGVRRLFSAFKEIELGIADGPFYVLFDIILSIAKNFTSDDDCNFVLWFISLWLFWPLKYLDVMFSENNRFFGSAAAIYYIGEK